MKMKVMIDSQTYLVDVEDIHARPVIAVVEGERYEVWPEDEAGQFNAQAVTPTISAPAAETPAAPAATPSATGGKDVPAPLPGVIVAILVKPGDKVARGQELCTLEAMKMKNAIRSSREGTIASVEVAVGDQVSHGQVLMTFSE
ncbi:MAG: biotin/lipoyl-binding protein [Anaerolineaceae bacterium]|nr:biotin/lipoyl-binding protein [Anaerolineaceae bacterium]